MPITPKEYLSVSGRIDASGVVRSHLPDEELSPTENASEVIWKAISTAPADRTFLIQGQTGAEITYGAATKNILRLANWLLTKNVKSDDVVMLYGDNNIETVEAMMSAVVLAIPFFGITPKPAVFDLRAQMLELKSSVIFMNSVKLEVFKQTIQDPEVMNFLKKNLKTIVIQDREFENIITEFETFYLDDILTGSDIPETITSVPHFPVVDKNTHPYFMTFSSGSTGKPKAIVHVQRSIWAYFRLGIGWDVISACNKPLLNVGGNTFASMFIVRQQTLVIFDPCEVEDILAKVQRYKIALIWAASNYMWTLAHEDFEQKYDLSHLKYIVYLGSIIPRHLIEATDRKYNAKVLNMYGASEILIPITVDDVFEAGTALPNVRIKVVDLQTREIVGPGMVGEILIKSPTLMSHYLNNPVATAETIDKDGFYHTGDVGMITIRGRLFIMDRIKEMIKYRDCGVAPSEIEACIGQLPDVKGVCVVGVPNVIDNAHARAYVKLAEGSKLKEEEIVEHVRKSLSYLKHLYGGVRFVDEIPTVTIGKIDRNYFRRLVESEVNGA